LPLSSSQLLRSSPPRGSSRVSRPQRRAVGWPSPVEGRDVSRSQHSTKTAPRQRPNTKAAAVEAKCNTNSTQEPSLQVKSRVTLRVIMKAARSVNHRSLRPSQELLAVGHKSTRVQRAANKRKRHLRKRRALYVSAGAQPALSSRGGMSVRVRRCGRGTRQSHYSLSLL